MNLNRIAVAFAIGRAYGLGRSWVKSQGMAQDADKWITVHPNGKDDKGTPVKLDAETGEVKAGMGGKFNGKHISAVPKGGSEEQHGAQAKIDRAKAVAGGWEPKKKEPVKPKKRSEMTPEELEADDKVFNYFGERYSWWQPSEDFMVHISRHPNGKGSFHITEGSSARELPIGHIDGFEEGYGNANFFDGDMSNAELKEKLQPVIDSVLKSREKYVDLDDMFDDFERKERIERERKAEEAARKRAEEEKKAFEERYQYRRTVNRRRAEKRAEMAQDELKNIKDRNSYEYKRCSLEAKGVFVEDFEDVDKNLLGASFDALSGLFDKYPEAMEDFLSESGALGETYEKCVASMSFSGVMRLNPSDYKSGQSMRDSAKKCIESGFWVDVADEYLETCVIYHEFGHHVHNTLTRKAFEAAKYNLIKEAEQSYYKQQKLSSTVNKLHNKMCGELVKEILKIAQKNTKLKLTELKKKYMSRYGQTNNCEFFAEAFANAHCGKPNPIGEAMMIFLKEKLNNGTI